MPRSARNYSAGDVIRIGVDFHVPAGGPDSLDVGGNLQLKIRIGDGTRRMNFEQLEVNRVIFAYAVQPGDLDNNGIQIRQNPFLADTVDGRKGYIRRADDATNLPTSTSTPVLTLPTMPSTRWTAR